MRGQLVGRYRAWDDAIDAQRGKNEIYWAQKTDRRTEEKNLVFGWGVVEERGRTMKTDAQFGFSGGGGGKRLLFNVGRTDGCKEVVRKISPLSFPAMQEADILLPTTESAVSKMHVHDKVTSLPRRTTSILYILSDVRKEDTRSTTACVLHYEFIAPDSSCKSTHTD